MLNRKSLLRIVAAAVAVSAFSGSQGTASAAPSSGGTIDPQMGASSLYLWKDSRGRCPSVCDNNQYYCPCMIAAQ
jgi:hypothetical protein